ncbi:MAG: ABC-type metal ion transport system, periplasmic component/surface antigen [Clostridiales bacterium]|jgi:D-methionine transport system substrate-binding protein|nr:ABC-type metal ion transport system, periplasmic component/surface antigen [Clostridiales bacterium]
MKNTKKAISLLTITILLILGLAACASKNSEDATVSSTKDGTKTQTSSDNSTNEFEGSVIKLGVVGENNEQWEPVIATLAEEGITLEIIKFADYTLPNQALADSEIDLNAFQHYAYLNNEIKDKGFQLTVIGETIIAPLGLYSSKITDLNEIKEGDKIAIPNDATNGGRSLKLLEAAGLIIIDPATGYLPTLSNITENKLKLEFFEVEAANTSSLLPDVAAAVINGGHAVDAGLVPETDSIYLETIQEGSDNPYINIIVARTEDAESALYQKVVTAYRTTEVANVIKEAYNGAYIPTWK